MNIKLILYAPIVLVCLISINLLNAQNYRVLQPERTSLYQDQDDIMLGMRIDSVRIEGSDTIFYLLKNLQLVDYNCFHIEGPSWMGGSIILQPNGETIFHNLSGQPIMIKTQASLNEEWICYSTVELSFRAVVSSTGIAGILGIPDSVKTISFQALDADGQHIAHEVNNLNIVLSKNHGIVKTLNFCSFPDYYLGYIFQTVSEFTLAGYTNPPAGIQNLTWNEVYDHNTGDELHTVEVYSNITYSRRMETISLLLDKSVNGDTISYNWEQRIKIMINSDGNNTFTASIDTFLQKIYPNPVFNLLPGVAFETNDSEFFTTTVMKEGFHGRIKSILGGSGTVTHSWSDSCYYYVIFDGCFPDNDYYNGLGGPYYYEQFGFDECSNQLVYYKKDGVEWGTPISFTVNTTLQPVDTRPEIIKVFPNPAQNLVNITFKDNTGDFRLQIIDNSGREITGYPLNGDTNTIDLTNLKPGIYLLKFLTENQIITEKLIKL